MNFEVEIVEVNRMPNTFNGNPRFSIIMNPLDLDHHASQIVRLTAKDHMFVFGIVPSDLEGKFAVITEDDNEYITNINQLK
jgi:hypothetical protein